MGLKGIDLRSVFGDGELEIELPFRCGESKVILRFAAELRQLSKVLGEGYSMGHLRKKGPEVLPLITGAVQILVEGAQQISARFTAAECPTVLKGKWPCPETLEQISWAVKERKQYPVPLPGVPGEGGKSMSAQGQTKKDGSHSQDRHK